MLPRNFNSFQTFDPSFNKNTLFSGMRRTAAIMAPVRLGNRPLAEAPAPLALSQDRDTLPARAAAEAKANAKAKPKAKARLDVWRPPDARERNLRSRIASRQRVMLWVLVRRALLQRLPETIVSRIILAWRG